MLNRSKQELEIADEDQQSAAMCSGTPLNLHQQHQGKQERVKRALLGLGLGFSGLSLGGRRPKSLSHEVCSVTWVIRYACGCNA